MSETPISKNESSGLTADVDLKENEVIKDERVEGNMVILTVGEYGTDEKRPLEVPIPEGYTYEKRSWMSAEFDKEPGKIRTKLLFWRKGM